MVSGFGLHGGKGRCFSLFRDFVDCVNGADPSQKASACMRQHEDYKECIHLKKTAERQGTIEAERRRRAADGTLPEGVSDLLTKDFKTGVSAK